MLLASCASKPVVRTETVTVHTPVYIAIPAELTQICTVALPQVWKNSALADYAILLSICLNTVNNQLYSISKLQPRTTP
jgi:hypothetical protein